MEVLETLAFVLLSLVVLLPLIFMATSAQVAKKFPGKISAYTLLVFGTAWLGGMVSLGIVIFQGPLNFSLLSLQNGPTPLTLFGFLADRVSLILLTLVITVSGVVHLYSLRAMQEERHFSRYFTLLTLVTVEVLLVVLANNLLMLGLFWICKGLTLTFLLAHYQERKASWGAAFKKLRVDLLGAAAMVGALSLTWQIFGTFEIARINQLVTQAGQTLPADQLTLLTALLFVAAMAKSAQFPLHGWLPSSVEAPTPVSALMHAGLINAGGFLLIRLSPLFVATPLTMGLVIGIGGFTAFYGTLIMLTRNDVKGMLVYSTMGQMGFMMLECGLGAFGLAILHIVAHGLFKATLFLSSGSVIQQKSLMQHLAPADHNHPTRLSLPRFLMAGALAALLFLFGPGVLGYPITSANILLAFAWITLVYAIPVFTRLPLAAWLVGLTGFILAYLVITHAIEEFFKPVVAPLPILEPAQALLISGGLILAGLALVLLRRSTRPVWVNQFLNRLYVRVLFADYGK